MLGLGLAMPGGAPGTIIVGGEPVEPYVLMDFKNAVYTVDGDAVALSTIVTEDDTFGQWDEASITAGVGIDEAASMTLTGEALTLVLAGSTAIYTFVTSGNNAATIQTEMIDWPDFNTYYYARVGSPASNNRFNDNVADTVYDYDGGEGDVMPNGTHKVAVTMINGKIARSIDGAAVVSINPAEPWAVAPNFLGITVAEGDVVLEALALYPAQPDAELPALSAL
jgi:hypothetical protein